jgi:DNA polymerase V
MLVTDWPNAIAHVDCDCFYASCERARRPDLQHTPICVLSSQDACVVAKTYDAKAAGITTGMPVWEARRKFPHAAFIPADFNYYGQMSDQMFALLSRYSPDVEVYSIDEGFLDLNGLRGLWKCGFKEMADTLRETVQVNLGITVSVGISVTKTLAKIASEFNKPNGTTLVSGRRIEAFLGRIPLLDIPGIGRNRQAMLTKCGMLTALDFVTTRESEIRRLLGKMGVDLWRELRGEVVFPLELEPRLPKSIARTASLGEVTDSKEILAAHLTHHTTRLAMELVTKRYLAARLSVFLRLKSFESAGLEVRLPYPTASYFTLMRWVSQLLAHLHVPGQLYRGCGVVASDISVASNRNLDLFMHMETDIRQGQLFETMDAINRKFGRGTVQMAAALGLKHKQRQPQFRYPMVEIGAKNAAAFRLP